jgi:ribosomal protein S27AE
MISTSQMSASAYPVSLTCPYCLKGKTMADHTANVNLSIQCGKCGQYYIGNPQTGRTRKTRASPNKLKKVE